MNHRMTLSEQIQRSKSSEKIDFTKIPSLNQADPLVKVLDGPHIFVEPIWTVAGDFEGRMYANYIAEHPEYDGVYLRATVLRRLEQAAASLPSNLALVIRAGHRPTAVQKRLLHDVKQDYLDNHSDATEAEALDHARMYVSDPDIKLPPHCCGAAVDIELYDRDQKQYLDFGSPMNEDSDISHLHSPKVTPAQYANRLLLLETMLGAGFSSYYAEWWHYMYGDQIWAWFYGHAACLYNVIDIKDTK